MLRFKLSSYLVIAAILSVGGAPRAWADVMSFPGFTVPESVQFAQPEPSCGLDSVPTATTACSLSATTNYTITAPDGTAIVSIESSYFEGTVTDPYAGDITSFRLALVGMIDGQVYNGSQWVGIEPGEQINSGSGFTDMTGDPNDLIVNFEADPSTTGTGYFQNHYGLEWTGLGQSIYMGDEFVDQGQTYYGWLEFIYNFGGGDYPPRADDVPNIEIGGYAYESCPNAGITVGATGGGATCSDPLDPPDPPDPPAPELGTLLLFGTGILAVIYLVRRIPNRAQSS